MGGFIVVLVLALLVIIVVAKTAVVVPQQSAFVVERLGNSGTRSEEREVFGDFDRHLLGPVFYYSWGGDNDRAEGKARKGLRLRGAGANGRNGDDDKNGDSEAPGYTLGAGVLFGLNENTSDVALKWSLEVEF